MPAPANDLRANATLLVGTSGTQSGTTVDCVADSESGGVYATWRDVWYYWSSLSAGRVRVMLDPVAATYTELALYSEAHATAAADNTNFIGYTSSSTGAPHSVEVDHPGGELTLVVANDTAPHSTAFSFSWESPSTPANDTRAGAEAVPGATGGTVTGTTKGAHAELSTVYGSVFDVWFDVWYQWASLPAGVFTITYTPDDTAFTEISLWAQSAAAAAADYDDPEFLGYENSGPWTLSVYHPGGPLTLAVATYGLDSTDFSFDWSWTSSSSASMLGQGVMSATPLVPAGGAYAAMIGQGTMSATAPARGDTIRVLITHVDGVVICELPAAIVSPISASLNDPESFSVTLLQGAPFGEVLMTPFREVQVWRGDQLIVWGPITRWACDKDVIVAQCKGAMWHLTRRYIGKANRFNWVNNPSFENELDQWGFATNAVMLAYGQVGAQADPPARASVLFPKVEGHRAMSLENTVAGADAYASQQFNFVVDASSSPEGDEFTLKGYVQLTAAIPPGQGAFGNRGLYLERFSTTELNPDPTVQAVLPGAMKSLETQVVKLDENTPVGVWKRFEVQLTTPPKGGEPEIINVRLYAPAGVVVYWDAIGLTRIEKLAFYGVDQAQIIEGIVAHAQDPDYDKSDVNITTECPPTGVLRTKVYVHSEHPPVWSAIQAFTDMDDGVDVRFKYTATQRILTTIYPHSGVYKPQWSPGLPGNVAEWTVSFDGEQAASSVIVLGSGSGSDREEGRAFDVSGWSDQVTMEKVFTAPDDTSIDSLGSIAAEQLRVGRNPLTIEVTLFAAEPGGLPDLIGNVFPGDEVDVSLRRHHLIIDDVYRVVKTEIDLNHQKMSLTLNPRITG